MSRPKLLQYVYVTPEQQVYLPQPNGGSSSNLFGSGGSAGKNMYIHVHDRVINLNGNGKVVTWNRAGRNIAIEIEHTTIYNCPGKSRN